MQAVTQRKPYKGMSMEGRVATWYARNTGKDKSDFRELADRLSQQTPAGSKILEVAPGPGYLSIEFARSGHYEVTGLDISKSFVQIARENARKESLNIDFQLGNASAMPFKDDSFDLILCRAAFKNFSQPVEALQEMRRVLRPGGRAVIGDLRKDVSWAEISSYTTSKNLGWVDSLITKLILRFMLTRRAHTSKDFEQMASTAGFANCKIDIVPLGLEVVLRK
ncbi:MAG TPA: class I SAM-dependent methyltransferase [Candidatus Angelobacter sp.]|nr:class I SAM-dependent methyltransferase [Candidatus Angelobacter sp.]